MRLVFPVASASAPRYGEIAAETDHRDRRGDEEPLLGVGARHLVARDADEVDREDRGE